MAGDVRLVIHENSIHLLARTGGVRASLDRLAAMTVQAMKYSCPVSPVMTVYANPVTTGGGKVRYGGDLPLRPSGYLRNSIHAERQANGTILVGSRVSYAAFVNNGTRAHRIESHGPWPLRNRATGAVYGRVVHHPGTRGAHFVEKAAAAMDGRRIR